MSGPNGDPGVEGERKLVAAMLTSAVTDAQLVILPSENPAAKERYRLKSRAVAWLASVNATTWFDFAGISQTRALVQPWWRRSAREVLAAEPNDYHPLIQQAILRVDQLVKRKHSREDLLRVDQVAHLLQVSTRSVLNYIRKRGLPVVRVTPGTLRVKPEDLNAWLEARESQP